MLSGFMIPRRPRLRALARLGALLASFVAGLAAVACTKVPLLAPSSSTITIASSTTFLPVNGSTDIVVGETDR